MARISGLLLVAATALMTLQAGEAEVSSEASDHRRRALSPEGLDIPGRWIAKIEAEDCGEARKAVNDLKAASPKSLASQYGAVDASEVEITTVCFVVFSGDAYFKSLVEKSIRNLVYIVADKVVVTSAAPVSWGLDRIDQNAGPLDMAPFGITHSGQGVSVYVLDTGIYIEHSDYEGRAVYGGDFINEEELTDMNGHGTHCAGTIGGHKYGVAKDSSLIGVKVLAASGSGSWSGIINALSWVVQNATNDNNEVRPGVISMSLGGGKSTAINDAVKAASDAGMVVVVAAGNSYDDACDYSPASTGGRGHLEEVITVGATAESDYMSSFSNYGTCVDIFAPGTSILSAGIAGPDSSVRMSGTSMACPHVAGVAAALLEKNGMSKPLAVRELFDLVTLDKIYFNNDGPRKSSPNKLLQVPGTIESNLTNSPTAIETLGPTMEYHTYWPTFDSGTPAPSVPTSQTAPSMQPSYQLPCELLSRKECKMSLDRCVLYKPEGKRGKKCLPKDIQCENLNSKDCKTYPHRCTLERMPGKKQKQCFSVHTQPPTAPNTTFPGDDLCDLGRYDEAETICHSRGMRLCSRNDLFGMYGFPEGRCKSLGYSRVWVEDGCRNLQKRATYEAGYDRLYCALDHSIQFYVCCPSHAR